MADLTLRLVKGAPLTNVEMDNNFQSLNTELASKAASADLNSAINSVNMTITLLEQDLETQIEGKLDDAANSVKQANVTDGIISPQKLSPGAPTWTTGGNFSATAIVGTPILNSSAELTTLTVSGATTLAGLTATINNSPIGATIASTGRFTTLSANSIDSTPIGANTPSTGAFTTLTATNSNLGNASATSINSTPIGNATPSTGVFSTLNATSINAVNIGNVTPGAGVFTSLSATALNNTPIGTVTPRPATVTDLTATGNVILQGRTISDVASNNTLVTRNATGISTLGQIDLTSAKNQANTVSQVLFMEGANNRVRLGNISHIASALRSVTGFGTVRGWIFFNAISGQIYNSNLLTLSKLGAGRYRINLDVSIRSGSYTPFFTSGDAFALRSGSSNVFIGQSAMSAYTTNYFDIRHTLTSEVQVQGAGNDSNTVSRYTQAYSDPTTGFMSAMVIF